MKHFLLLCAVVLNALFTTAQVNTYSYLYIEGDKETPFYVKMEGQMTPRLGQHYAILSNLDKGTTNIEILFQQNKYPAQKFKIKIPESGARGMQLRKVTESQFALYDLQTGLYILSGNNAEDDNIDALERLNDRANQAQVKADKNNVKLIADKEKIASTKATEEDLPKFEPSKTNKNKPKENTSTKVKANDATVKKTKAPASTQQKDEEPKLTSSGNNKDKAQKSKSEFIDNVAINQNEDGSTHSKNNSNLPPNTDCKEGMNEEVFTSFLQKIQSKSEDDDRIKIITKNKKNCYTTDQAKRTIEKVRSQSGRLLVAKQLYAQTSDQENFEQLKDLFKSEYLQNKFMESIKKQ